MPTIKRAIIYSLVVVLLLSIIPLSSFLTACSDQTPNPPVDTEPGFETPITEPDGSQPNLPPEPVEPVIATTVRLDVPLINQFPLAPTGCEIASLTMLLNYAGYETSFEQSLNEMWYSSDPNSGFVGDPRKWNGWTIYPDAAGRWIEQRIGSYQVMTDASLEELCDVLRDEKPIVVWIIHPTIGMHSCIITGFDENGFYLNDPYGTKDWFCDYETFDSYWAGYSRMALTY